MLAKPYDTSRAQRRRYDLPLATGKHVDFKYCNQLLNNRAN